MKTYKKIIVQCCLFLISVIMFFIDFESGGTTSLFNLFIVISWGDYPAYLLLPLGYIVISFLLIANIFIKNNKVRYLLNLFYLAGLFTIIAGFTFKFMYKGMFFGSWSFYLSLLLFFVYLLSPLYKKWFIKFKTTTFYITKIEPCLKKTRKPTNAERIAALEKQVAELKDTNHNL